MNKNLLLLTLFTILILMTFVGTVAAQREYHLEHEWVKIWINQNGSIDLLHDISITLDSGPNINYVYIGQPKRDFTIGIAMDQSGHTLAASDASSGSDYKVQVNLYEPLTAGQTVRFNLTTNVARMIYEDTQNPGNVGMQFTPTWWEEASVHDLRVLIVLPSNVTVDMVKTSVDWDNVLTEDDQLAIYWERQNLSPNQRYDFGVSFPKEFIQEYVRVFSAIGVKEGDWIKYNIEAEIPEIAEEAMEAVEEMEWIKIKVKNVYDTTVNLEGTIHYKNGTEETEPMYATGTEMGFIIGADQGEGDEVIVPLAFVGPTAAYINGTVPRTYSGASREVNYVDVEMEEDGTSIDLEAYWDKATGVLCEVSVSMSGEIVAGYTVEMSMSYEMTETNMWEAEVAPFWMQWWLWTIVAVVIVALAGAVYFLKKRRPPTPTAPTLPTEGTLQNDGARACMP